MTLGSPFLFKRGLRGDSLPRSLANTYPFNYNDDIIYKKTPKNADTKAPRARRGPRQDKHTVNTIAGMILQTHVERNKQAITRYRMVTRTRTNAHMYVRLRLAEGETHTGFMKCCYQQN